MIDININATENITEREPENGLVKSVKIMRHGKDGELIEKEIFTPAVIESYETIDYLRKLKDVSQKGLCIEISLLNDETLKKEGFKGGVAEFIRECFGTSLDTNTAQRYRKVGLVFGEKSITEDGKIEYNWCDGVADDTTVTNLGQVIALVGLPKDYMKLTKEEIIKLRNNFLVKYVFSGDLHLDTINRILRDEIKALSNTIVETTAEEITETENDTESGNDIENDTESGNDIESEEETAKDNAVSALDTLKVYFKGNTNALKLIAKLAKEIG